MYHCHSDYSLQDSCTKFADYVDLAVQNGQPAVASTEHGKPMGWAEKKMLCDAKGVRFIHGCEIYLTETLSEKVKDNYHTVLLARNLDGVHELNEIVSRSCDEQHFYYKNRISFDEFLSLSDNIITTSACLASPLNKLPMNHPRYMELVGRYDFLEIQHHIDPEQAEFNRKLWDLARKFGKPLIAGTDTHSSTPYKAECRRVLLKSYHKDFDNEDRLDLVYKTYDQLVEAYRIQDALPESVFMQAIENTNLLYDMTEDFELDRRIKYPILYGTPKADSRRFRETEQAKLEQKIQNGIIPAEQVSGFRTALQEETAVFEKLGMSGFMLSMGELVSWCKEQGFVIGPARGSVGGSRAAYITDIIDLNPEQWHTVFSRFCNEDRVEVGDIDIDVIKGDRPAIFAHIRERFGKDKTARVASFGTIQDKKAIEVIGRAFLYDWEKQHPNDTDSPWLPKKVDVIKKEFEKDPDGAKAKYPELFYYLDGLQDIKVSQSVHPAGMVVSPITLADHYGVFNKDGEDCLFLDMDEAHDVGLVKYDFLVLKTLQVLRDTCDYIGTTFPKSHEVDWDDQTVWKDLLRSPACIFQFEEPASFKYLKQFKPTSIFDMSLVTAALRPSGASYRKDLMARKPKKNPSPIIDELLRDNLGYLVYQEDTIKFLQQICGMTGSEADTIRRAIAHKDEAKLNAALPAILDGYCSKSDQPRKIAEAEAKEFLQIIQDSASYQFGYNHSIAYCLLSYLCAYYRCYCPIEFLTSYLNNAANNKDIQIGTDYAKQVGIQITMPKWGISRADYFYDKERNIIAKGVTSIKYMSDTLGEELYELSQRKHYDYFVDLLADLNSHSTIDARQLDILIKIDFFSDFGNQRELLRIAELFSNTLKGGTAKQVDRAKVDGTPLGEIIQKYSNGTTKAGGIAKRYALLDVMSIAREAETYIKSLEMDDLSDVLRMQNFKDIMGYAGYTSGKEEDRRKLYVNGVYPLSRKRDGKQFGYAVLTRSIGSGKESRFTVFNRVFDLIPIQEGDTIYCHSWEKDGPYFHLTAYDKIT